MSWNFNLNHFFKQIFGKVLLVVLILTFIGIVLYLVLNGGHHKLPGGIETNIPKKDKTTIENNKIKIGTIHGDVLTDSSTKIINNGLPDSVQKNNKKNK